MNELDTYYFTFASDHPLANYWIEIHALTSMSARRKMIEMHGKKWSMQYEARDFEPEYFPAGRHGDVIEVI